MGTFFKIIGYVVGVLVIVIAATLFAARFADGPLEIIAGGPFQSGDLATEEPDWAFVRDYNTVEFQLLDPEASRTTWIAVHDGRVFIPSGYMTTWWGKIWKQWPLQALEAPEAILRVDGTLYERELVRITDPTDPAIDPVIAELSRKYAQGQSLPRSAFDSGYLWIFELVPRSP